MNEMTKLKRKPGLMTASMNGSAVMMDIETGKYYNLGETGGRIWELLDPPATVTELCDQLTQEYDVSREVCMKDLQGFLQSLMDRGLISQV